MSHLAKIELEIKDIQILKKACKRLGLKFMSDQKNFRWYGREPAECSHAIKIPNAAYDYEIGVIKQKTGYELQCDFFDRGIKASIGQNGGLLKQAYTIEKAKMECIKKGYSVREEKTQKGVQLRITVR